MVKQMAELLGGSVAVASDVGAGSCFAAWLPLRVAGAAIPLPHPGVTPSPAGEAKDRVALVIEDDERAGDLVGLLLEAEGFSVVRATSAEEALTLAPRQDLSLITLDVQLPGITGWDFLVAIRDDPVLSKVPVVIISGAAEGNMAVRRGAAAILHKPIRRADLTASLMNLGLHESGEPTRTVLVVDDDPKAVELIAALLPAPAYAVVRAYGGAEAIVLARRVHPDLILLDLMMPDVNGFDVVEALQGDTHTAGIPILVVTAKEIVTEDRTALNPNPRNVVRIVEKAGLDRRGFMAEVRRALP
jgi:CheY-like chemotaxis protein